MTARAKVNPFRRIIDSRAIRRRKGLIVAVASLAMVAWVTPLGLPTDAVRREDLTRLGAAAEEAEACWRALEAARYGGGETLPEARLAKLLQELAT